MEQRGHQQLCLILAGIGRKWGKNDLELDYRIDLEEAEEWWVGLGRSEVGRNLISEDQIGWGLAVSPEDLLNRRVFVCARMDF